MSGKVSGIVWDSDLPQNDKYVLLSYADHADHEGKNMFPSAGLTAWKTGYSKRSVQRITKKLVAAGVLVPVGVVGKGAKKYYLDFEKLPKRPPYSSKDRGDKLSPQNEALEADPEENRGDNLSGRGDIAVSGRGDIAMSPKPSLTVNEPTRGAQSADGSNGNKKETNYLPPADVQMNILMAGRTNGHDADIYQFAEQVLVQSGWNIRSGRIKNACIHFLAATGWEVAGSDKTRGVWINSFKQHLDDFGQDNLYALYEQAYREAKFTVKGPQSLSNSMMGLHQQRRKQRQESTDLTQDPQYRFFEEEGDDE
jgi:hypothetical protein